MDELVLDCNISIAMRVLEKKELTTDNTACVC